MSYIPYNTSPPQTPSWTQFLECILLHIILWNLIAKVTDTGLANHVVCNRIYQHYGQECLVTQIIKVVTKDKKRRYVPPILQVA